MVTEFLLNIVWFILKPLLDLLPTVEINIASDTFNIFYNAVEAVCYLLPMSDIIIMVGIVFSITVFRIIVSFIRTIWELLPMV